MEAADQCFTLSLSFPFSLKVILKKFRIVVCRNLYIYKNLSDWCNRNNRTDNQSAWGDQAGRVVRGDQMTEQRVAEGYQGGFGARNEG